MQRQRGFTLIEILVVVSILGVLAGLISLLVVQAQGKKDEMNTKLVVETYLPTAIDRFKQEFSKLPPATMAELAAYPRWTGLTLTQNTTNECNECMLVALRHPDSTTPLPDLPIPFGNTDEDIWNKVPDGSPDENAKEVLDAWGNPVVYIRSTFYDTPVKIMKVDGTEIEVHAVKRPSGNVYYNQNSYQIISLGKNGIQDDDDIVNFTKED
jgi:prepilin-type N-terminal cleavage/methylation domain-containing protein